MRTTKQGAGSTRSRQKAGAKPSSPVIYFGLAALLFAAALTLLAYALLSLHPLPAWLAGVNATALLFYGYDKWEAGRSGWRVPEKVLHGLVILGGWVGAIAGMYLFRHKISKGSFQRTLWVIIALEAAAVIAWFRLT